MIDEKRISRTVLNILSVILFPPFLMMFFIMGLFIYMIVAQ